MTALPGLLTASQSVGWTAVFSISSALGVLFCEKPEHYRRKNLIKTMLITSGMASGILTGATLSAATGSAIPLAAFTIVVLPTVPLTVAKKLPEKIGNMLLGCYFASLVINVVAPAILFYRKPSPYLLGCLLGNAVFPLYIFFDAYKKNKNST